MAFTIFYDATPRLFFHEIQMSQPCSQDAYMAESFEGCREILLLENRKSCPRFPETVLAFAEGRSECASKMENLNLCYLFSVIFGGYILYVSYRDSNLSAFRNISDRQELEKKRWFDGTDPTWASALEGEMG